MRWLVDENVSRIIVQRLRTAGHDVTFVTDAAPSSPDTAIYDASTIRRLVLTHDLDFGLIVFGPAVPDVAGVVMFRLRLQSKPFQWARLQAAITEYGETLYDRFTVIEDGRIRSHFLP